MRNTARCREDGYCFARHKNVCEILKTTTFKSGCPFKKVKQDVTNGKEYPFDFQYERRFRHD